MSLDRQRIVSSGRWVALSTFVTSGIGFLTTLLLPKFIPPEEFGLFALGVLVVNGIQRLGHFGQAEFVVYKGKDDGRAQQTAFTTFVFCNLLFIGLQIPLASSLASFFHQARLAPLYRWLTISYALSAIGLVPSALLNRDLKFKAKFWPELCGVLAYTGAGLTLALAGAGAWALIGATWAMSSTQIVLMARLSGWRPRVGWDGSSFREMMRYGTPLFLAGLGGYLYQNIDRFAIGRSLGAQALGHYAVALQFALVLSTKANGIIGTVAFPSYAQVQGELELVRRIYLKALSLSSFAAGAITLVTLLLARPFVQGVYGQAWMPTVAPLQILALYGYMALLAAPAVLVLMALGKTRMVFYMNLLTLALAAALLPLALRHGIAGVASVMALTFLAGGTATIGRVHRHLKVRAAEVVFPLGGFPLIAGLCLLLGIALGWTRASSLVFPGLVPAGASVVLYVLAGLGFDRDLRRSLRSLLFQAPARQERNEVAAFRGQK